MERALAPCLVEGQRALDQGAYGREVDGEVELTSAKGAVGLVQEPLDRVRYPRQLRAGRSRTIGLVVLDVANPFFTDLARGVEVRSLVSRLSPWKSAGVARVAPGSFRPDGERLAAVVKRLEDNLCVVAFVQYGWRELRGG